MKRCYEFLRCTNADCKLNGEDDGPPCWEVEGTLCFAHERIPPQLCAEEKKACCRKCVYRHYAYVRMHVGDNYNYRP
jgi:hypothetical protein